MSTPTAPAMMKLPATHSPASVNRRRVQYHRPLVMR